MRPNLSRPHKATIWRLFSFEKIRVQIASTVAGWELDQIITAYFLVNTSRKWSRPAREAKDGGSFLCFR